MSEYFIREPGQSHSHRIPPIVSSSSSENNGNENSRAPWAPPSPSDDKTPPPKAPFCAEFMDVQPTDTTQTLAEKYGEPTAFLGDGGFGKVRLARKPDSDKVFAVKKYQTKEPLSEIYGHLDLGQRHYLPDQLPEHVERGLLNNFEKWCSAEFYVGISLKHPNLVQSLDLMRDAVGHLCMVMEFCAGGNLFEYVNHDKRSGGYLVKDEADCFFIQIMRGFKYLHERGLTHGDVKLENVLVTERGCAKLNDFGRTKNYGRMFDDSGSRKLFDTRTIDVWSAGVMQRKGNGYFKLNTLGNENCSKALHSIFEPEAEKRITAEQLLETPWAKEIHVCEAGRLGL
ncbi:serine/threonine-protein kinase [Leptodontidium sp. MPI-SDFR-AT-0119]|nr:serine/threonine-protein kinase [Leptodontidium sp. MPI-SDFR-AT-0119]